MRTPAIAPETLESLLRQVLGDGFRLAAQQALSGGDIALSLSVQGRDGSRHFVKLMPHEDRAPLVAEQDGLEALAASRVCRTPAVRGLANAGEQWCALVLEHLDLAPLSGADDGERAARVLHALHQCHGEQFGWHCDNYLGSNPQANPPGDNWARFVVRNRLQPQLARAAQNGLDRATLRQGEKLCDRVSALFLDYRPAPSLLHGDLWHGNVAVCRRSGEIVLFDPAVHHGDRESDLAMSELFGGFPPAFYATYRRLAPLNEGYETRKLLYSLYHLLNHFNLFGRSYLGEVTRLTSRLAAELSG